MNKVEFMDVRMGLMLANQNKNITIKIKNSDVIKSSSKISSNAKMIITNTFKRLGVVF